MSWHGRKPCSNYGFNKLAVCFGAESKIMVFSWIINPVLNTVCFSIHQRASSTLKDIPLDFRTKCELYSEGDFLINLWLPEKIAHRFSGLTAGGEWGLYYSDAECGLLSVDFYNWKEGIPFWWIRWAYSQMKYNKFKSLPCLPNRIYVFKSRKETFCFLFKC